MMETNQGLLPAAISLEVWDLCHLCLHSPRLRRGQVSTLDGTQGSFGPFHDMCWGFLYAGGKIFVEPKILVYVLVFGRVPPPPPVPTHGELLLGARSLTGIEKQEAA